MAINKVVYGDQTLIDLTSDTATAEDVVEGKTFHDASGQLRTGTGGGGGGSANIVELTQAEYDALPSSKESDNVLYIVYFDGGQILDPDYSYHKYGDNDEIIVRVYHEGLSDQQTLWFFNGWNQTSLDMSIPTELQAYKPSNTSPIFSDSYATVGGTQTSWFGFYNNNFRSWDLSLGGQYIGIIHAVVNPFPSSTGQQMNGYYSPYVYIQSSTPTRRIYLNEHEYSEFNKTNVEELTQTDYDALSPTQKNNGGIYFIKKQSGGTYTEQHSLTFLNISTPFNVGENFVSAEGAFANDSSYSISISVNGTTCSASRIHNGVVEYTSTNCTYENGVFTFDTYFVQYYCGTSTVDFTCTYDSTTYVGDKIYHMDKIYGDESGGGGNYYLNTLYSTEEKKIGYWTDGKPLYQKDVEVNSVAYNDWTDVFYLADADIKGYDSMTSYAQLSNGERVQLDWFVTTSIYNRSIITNSGTRFRVETHGNNYSKIVATILYTKTTDTAEPNPQFGNVIYLPTIYSEEERQVGVWTDGKPLYQITVDVANPSNDSNEHLIDLSALSIEKCPYLFGYAVRHSGANDLTYYANSIETDGWYYFKARYDNFRDSIMYICLFKNDSISRMKFTIQYTKTTDTAGSGDWTPSGARAVHYSTNEQVVGTWIDGKPLYQRTINYISSISAGVHNIETLTDVDNIVSMQGIGIYQTQKIPIPYYGGNNDFYLLWTDGANLQEYRGSANGFSGTQMYVTIQYTKTTD